MEMKCFFCSILRRYNSIRSFIELVFSFIAPNGVISPLWASFQKRKKKQTICIAFFLRFHASFPYISTFWIPSIQISCFMCRMKTHTRSMVCENRFRSQFAQNNEIDFVFKMFSNWLEYLFASLIVNLVHSWNRNHTRFYKYQTIYIYICNNSIKRLSTECNYFKSSKWWNRTFPMKFFAQLICKKEILIWKKNWYAILHIFHPI